MNAKIAGLFVIGAALAHGQIARAQTVGQYWGYTAIDQKIHDRVLKDGSFFMLGKYLSFAPAYNGELLRLLGHFDFVSGQFNSADPNETNTLLWHLLLSQFSAELAQACDPPPPPAQPSRPYEKLPLLPELHPAVTSLVQDFCRWPDPRLQSTQWLYTWWQTFMGYEAPESEFEVWKDFVLANYLHESPKTVIVDATLALLMNPHFLLRK